VFKFCSQSVCELAGCILHLYNNTQSNAIVNAASKISYRPTLQAVVFCSSF
jgi:hypothetical protein